MKLESHMKWQVPGPVFATRMRTFDPLPFVPAPYRNWAPKTRITRETQCQALAAFCARPAGNYFVTSTPVERALFYAAWLMQHYKAAHPSADLQWIPIWPSSSEELEDGITFSKERDEPDFVVLEIKDAHDELMLEKVRDLATWNCPKVIVASGVDPLHLSVRLRLVANYAAYLTQGPDKQTL